MTDIYPSRVTAEAQMHCRRCPVAQECLEYALEESEKYGIWGGKSERQRRRLRRARSLMGLRNNDLRGEA